MKVSAAEWTMLPIMVSVADPPPPPSKEQVAAIEDFLTGLTELTRKTGYGLETESGYYEGETYLTIEAKYGLDTHFYVISDTGTLYWIDEPNKPFFRPKYVARQGR